MLTVLVFHVALVAALALAVEVACRVGRFRPAVCHLLWLVVLIKLSFPPVLAWPAYVQDMLPAASPVFDVIEIPGASVPAGPAVAPAVPPSIPLAQPSAPAAKWFSMPVLAAFLWAAGSLYTFALYLSRIRGFRALLREARHAPGWLQQCSDTLARSFGTRPPVVMTVSGLASAVVWNPWRSKVLVSQGLLDSIGRDAWAGILSHELAHLKRRDLWVGWLELAASCLWWWNPLLFLVRRRLHLYAELACDAWVLWAFPEGGRQYAEVLFRIVSSNRCHPAPVSAFGMAAGNATTFRRRLAMLLHGGVACHMPRSATAVAVALLAVAVPSFGPVAEAAKCRLAASSFRAPGGPETTRDAEAVLEMRLYVVKGRLRIHGSDSQMPGQEGRTEQCGERPEVYTRITPSMLTAGGLPISMEGETLLWNGCEEPHSSRVVHAASPVLALRGNDSVSVAVAVPVQALEWLNAKESLEWSFKCHPEKEHFRLWLNTLSPGSTDDSAAWMNMMLQAPANQWGALSAVVVHGKRYNDCVTLLMFWKRCPCAPSSPVRELPGPANGEFLVQHVDLREQASAGYIQFTNEINVFEAETAKIDGLVSGLPPVDRAVTSPEDLRLFNVSGGEGLKQIQRRLKSASDIELISASSVSFRQEDTPKLLARGGKGNDGVSMEQFERFSTSLVDFFNQAHPHAVIMDMAAELFVDGGKITPPVGSGLAYAIATQPAIHDGTLDIRFYYNYKELIRHFRGHLFWKRELMPDARETATTAEVPYRLGDSLCFITPCLNPHRERFVLLTIKQTDRAPTLSAEEANPGQG